MELSNGNLSYLLLDIPKAADTQLTINRTDLIKLFSGKMALKDMISQGAASVDGSMPSLTSLLRSMEADQRDFPLVANP